LISNVEDIIKGCKANDRRSQNALVAMYAPKLMAICLRYTKNKDQANDALQEAFINAFKYMHTFQGSGSFEGWMKRIAVNSSITYIKELKNHRWEDEAVIDTNSFAEVPEALDKLGKEEILELLKKLPHAQMVIFNMSIIEGYNHSEIASALNITESSSRATLCRARNTLVELIKKQEQNFDFAFNKVTYENTYVK
jgi:RNA polymerase sigma factor (sigma-70 family)